MRVPIWVTLLTLFIYLMTGASLFSGWEGWSFLDGSYFVFVTLSTIGFGDLVPGKVSSVSVCLIVPVSLPVSVFVYPSPCLSVCIYLSLSAHVCPCLRRPVFLPVSLCLCLSLSVTVCLCLSLSVWLSLSLCPSLSDSLYVCLSVCLCVCLSLPLSICHYVCLFVCLCLYICLSV